MSHMSKAALYLRVSTGEQKTANQRPELEAMASARGWEIFHVYEEHESAAKRRPVLEQVLADARRAKFSVLLIWALDRLGRSTLGNLLLVHELDGMGITLVSSRDSWLETKGPARTLLISLLSWVAEQERIRIGERTRAGMDRARAHGKHVGRPRGMTRPEIVRAQKMREKGRSFRSIARALKIPKTTVRRWLEPGRKGDASEPPKSDG